MTNSRFADIRAAIAPVFDRVPDTREIEALLPGEHKILARTVLALRRGPLRYSRGETIVIESEASEYIFLVVSGVVRSLRSFQDGTRSIVAFHLPGELFGLTNYPTHSLTAEAAKDAMILFFKRSALLSVAEQESQVASFLLTAALNENRRLQERSLLIGRDAKCRVAAFLIDLSMRTRTQKYLELSMSHQDVADYLGLKIETVSRVITQLEASALIARGESHRSLILKNRSALARVAS
jgi:CRP/FNR family transcriptional regulator, nitrogen fixation regulation protein